MPYLARARLRVLTSWAHIQDGPTILIKPVEDSACQKLFQGHFLSLQKREGNTRSTHILPVLVSILTWPAILPEQETNTHLVWGDQIGLVLSAPLDRRLETFRSLRLGILVHFSSVLISILELLSFLSSSFTVTCGLQVARRFRLAGATS
jgi:hypothetical protein